MELFERCGADSSDEDFLEKNYLNDQFIENANPIFIQNNESESPPLEQCVLLVDNN